MRRQQYLARGMRLTAIMSEAAVRQRIGGPELLRKQLHHLTRTVRDYDVTVQVVPFTAVPRGTMRPVRDHPMALETDPEAV